GQNVAVEHRWAGRQYDRLPDLAAEMVHRQVAVIVGNSPPALAAKKATSTVPIVFFSGADPVKLGLVASFNRPGGNATGVFFFTSQLGPKRLGLLLELVPKASVIAVLLDAKYIDVEAQQKDAADAGRTLGRRLEVLKIQNEEGFEPAFAKIGQLGVGAMVVSASPYF